MFLTLEGIDFSGKSTQAKMLVDALSRERAVCFLREPGGTPISERIRTILAEHEPLLVTWDQPAVAAARNDQAKETSDLLTELAELRADSLALVRGLGRDDLDRAGIHPKVGRLTVQDLVHEWVYHDREHLKQLFEVSRTFAWDGMGGARRFTEPAV